MCLIWRKADCSPSGLSVQQVIERNLPISTGAGDESSLRTQQQPERTPSKQTTSVCYFHLHILLMVSFVRYKLSVCPANCCCRVESQRLRRCYVGGERVDFWTCWHPTCSESCGKLTSQEIKTWKVRSCTLHPALKKEL
jgi:hypothetical protein